MLAELKDWGEEVALVPNSGIQFLDFGLNLDEHRRLSRRFIERAKSRSDGNVLWQLLRYPDLEGDEVAASIYDLQQDDLDRTVSTTEAIEIFLGKWVPVPFLRVRDGTDMPQMVRFDQGPTNWARVRIVEIPSEERGDGPSHRVIFAFDTAIEETRPNRPYVAPSKDDVTTPTVFRLASRLSDVGWFFADTRTEEERGLTPWFQGWIDDWLMANYEEFMIARYPKRRFRREEMEHPLEHWMRYVALLETLSKALQPPKLRFIDTITLTADETRPKVAAVNVDLILDVGNSRTCGLLVESYPNGGAVDLNDALVLQLRDLGRPEMVYSDPFSSHVELAQPKFGRHDLSRRSSRPAAFLWPSMVRVGPEAERLRAENDGTGPTSGMSSPKRYLWDTDPVQRAWEFQPSDYGSERRPPPIETLVRQRLNASGELIRQLRLEARLPRGVSLTAANELTFSRSSMFMLMLSEIIIQAIAMANSPGVRHSRQMRDAPRTIARILLTIPPATTQQERKILTRHAEGAVHLVWDLMGWSPSEGGQTDPELTRSYFRQPKIRSDLDEASCTQFVWLYGEITRKFSGAAEEYARLVGRERPMAEPEREPDKSAPLKPSIRIASVDVGGGTTDLMITTYYIERNRELLPTQNFREGFRTAGDDLVRGVIEEMVLPAIGEALKQAGITDARETLRRKFGGDRPEMSVQEKNLRRQFANKILQPLGLAILADHERKPAFTDSDVEYRTIGELLGNQLSPGNRDGEAIAADHLQEYLTSDQRNLAADFCLDQVNIPLDFRLLRAVAEDRMGRLADNMCEAIAAFDVDMVLISGRPARLPAITDMFLSRAPAVPNRVLSLAEYATDTWYPFRSADNQRIADPKTCTSVGGMLCVLAERQVENFTLMTHRLSMRSTARFIGPMENQGEITNDNLLFEDIDLDRRGVTETEKEFKWSARMRIGFRQLPLERWTTTPLYRLDFQGGSNFSTEMLPFLLTIERSDVDLETEGLSPEQILAQQAQREMFKITRAEDARGSRRKHDTEFRLSLCTLPSDDGYWLDTGIFRVS